MSAGHSPRTRSTFASCSASSQMTATDSGVPEHVRALLGRVRRVDRHDRGAGGEDAVVRERPLGARGAEDRDVVAGLDPERSEPAGDLADRGAELRVGDRIAPWRRERGPRAEALGGVERDPRDRRVLCRDGGHGWTPGGDWRCRHAARPARPSHRLLGAGLVRLVRTVTEETREHALRAASPRRVGTGPGSAGARRPRRVGTVAAELVLNRLWARPRRPHAPADRPVSAGRCTRPARARRAPGTSRAGTATVLQLDEYAGLGPGRPAQLRGAAARAARRASRSARSRTLDGAARRPAAEAARHAAVVEAGADRPRRARARARRARRVRRAAGADWPPACAVVVARARDPRGRGAGVRRRGAVSRPGR